MMPLTPTQYRSDPASKVCRTVLPTIIITTTIVCLILPSVFTRLTLHVPAALSGAIWSIITFNFFDDGLVKVVLCLPLVVGLIDSLETYLTVRGLLSLLLSAAFFNGSAVVLSSILHWKLTNGEAVFFGYHATEYALLGGLAVAWVQGNSHISVPERSGSNISNNDTFGDGHRRNTGLIATSVYPQLLVPVVHPGGAEFMPVAPSGWARASPWFFEGLVYKVQGLCFVLWMFTLVIERGLSVEAPRWLGLVGVVDVWSLTYGSVGGWIWLRYFHFYASVRSRGDPSKTFEFANVFFPTPLYPLLSPLMAAIHSTAAKLPMFRVDSQAPVPRVHTAPVLPLVVPDGRSVNLTHEQRSTRQKGLDALKVHMDHRERSAGASHPIDVELRTSPDDPR